MLDMIRAEEARQIAASANPEEEHTEADTLAENAMGWATRNAMARTNTRVRMYAKYGRTSLAVKFAPGELDGKGTGNSFYNDLLANSNTQVADAICAIIYNREQSVISDYETARLLNTFSAKAAKFVNDLTRMGYDVTVGDEAASRQSAALDDSTIIVSWA